MNWIKLRFPTVPASLVSMTLIILTGLLLEHTTSSWVTAGVAVSVLTVLMTVLLFQQAYRYRVNLGSNGTVIVTHGCILSPEDFTEADVVARPDGRTIVLRTDDGKEAHFLAAHRFRKLNREQVTLLGNIILQSNIPDFEHRSNSLTKLGTKLVVPVTKKELTSMLTELHQLAS